MDAEQQAQPATDANSKSVGGGNNNNGGGAPQQKPPASHPSGGDDANFVPQTLVLRMRGLPYDVTEDAVRDFFAGFELDDPEAVLLISQGFHRGEGYVRFRNAEHCSGALTTLNRKHIGERYVELYPSTDNAMQNAKAQQQQQLGSTRNFIVRLRGLPFSSSVDDVRAFFSEIPDAEFANVRICYSADGRPTGDAFVEVLTQEAVKTALGRNRQILGQRYIEVFDSTPHERDILMTSALRGRGGRGRGGPGGRGGMAMMHQGPPPGVVMNPGSMNVTMGTAPFGGMMPPPPGVGGLGGGRGGMMNNGQGGGSNFFGGRGMGPYATPMGNPFLMQMMQAQLAMQQQQQQQQQQQRLPSRFVVRVRGLPFSATEANVAEFFHDVQIPPQGVHMVYNAQERPTGEAFVEVFSEHDVQVALSHNGGALGHRYIEVFRSSGNDMSRLSGGAMPGGGGGNGGGGGGGGQGFDQGAMYPMGQMGFPYAQPPQFPYGGDFVGWASE